MEKYFKILGLSPDADIEEVKKAYRKLALQYHPDLQSGNEEHFKKIVEAYEMVKSHLESASEQKEMRPEDLIRFYELLKQAAEEKARKKAFERAARIRARKKAEQERSTKIAVYSFFAIVGFAFISFKAYFWHLDWQISRNPAHAIAEVVGIENHRMVYTFWVDDQEYEERVYVRGYGLVMLSSNGMPLKIGDQFVVHYRADKPSYNRVNTFQTSSNTLNRYFNLATESLLQYYNFHRSDGPKINRQKARCISLMIYQEEGLEGLVNCYHFNTNPLEYTSKNSLSWFFFWNKSRVSQLNNACGVETL